MSVGTWPPTAGSEAAAVARRRKLVRGFNERWPAPAAALGMVALWQLIIVVFKVPQYIAPSPLDVLAVFAQSWPVLWANFVPTFTAAVVGFVTGNVVAVLLAIWFVHSRMAERAFFPIAVFVNTIPIIAVAPILVLLLGNGFAPKMVISGLICFFPTLVNMVRGLNSMSSQIHELMRVLSASKPEVLFKVRLQSSVPYLFAALKIGSNTCVIGAIVSEWIGSNYGLGSLIVEATFNYRSPLLYATVIMSSGLAVLLFSLTVLAERGLVRWKPSAAH